MPYKNPKKDRCYKCEWEKQQARPEEKARRAARARLRRKIDKEHGPEFRKGKDVSHKKALASGGTNKDGWRLESPSKNRARGGALSKPKK